MALSDNLVAAWELDEASGDALDSYGSYDLTDNNTVGSTTGKIDDARSFNGTNEYFSGSVLSGSKTNLTLEAWIYRGSSSNLASVGWGDTEGSRFSILLYSDGNVYLQVETGDFNYPYCAFSGTGWHHFVLAFDGSQGTASNRVKAYIDGSEQSLTAGGVGNPSYYTVSGNFEIGREKANTRYTNGYHDATRLWERTLSSSEVSELYNSGSGRSGSYIYGGGGVLSSVIGGGVGNGAFCICS